MNLPISIAGIIQIKCCYSENTKSLLIEGSIFNALKFDNNQEFLGLRTDRSARYEKSLKDIFIRIIISINFFITNIKSKFNL
jgi:hypothetical protein